MAEKLDNNHLNVLRQRTVEEDLNQHLKSAMGGYTKKSVTEYINLLHEQQQKYAETFNNNMQSLLGEKESLKKENDRLVEQRSQLKSDYQTLLDSVKNTEQEQQGESEDLKKQLTKLTSEKSHLEDEINKLDTRIKQMENDLSQAKSDLQEAQHTAQNQNPPQELLDKLSILEHENKDLLDTEKQQQSRIEKLESDLSATISDLQKAQHSAQNQNPPQELLDKLSILEHENKDLLDTEKQQQNRIEELENNLSATISDLKRAQSEASNRQPSQEIMFKLAKLDNENRELINAGKQQKACVERLEKDLSVAISDLEKARQDVKTQSELLSYEKVETNKQRELVAQYSKTVDDLNGEIERLNEVLSEGEMAKLKAKISELTANASFKEEIIERYKDDLDQKSDEIEMISEQNSALQNSMDQIKMALKTVTEQNEKLMSANNALSSSLEVENKRIIQLLNEKSEQTVENLIAARKIEELNMKLTLQQKRTRKIEDDTNESIMSEKTSAS